MLAIVIDDWWSVSSSSMLVDIKVLAKEVDEAEMAVK